MINRLILFTCMGLGSVGMASTANGRMPVAVLGNLFGADTRQFLQTSRADAIAFIEMDSETDDGKETCTGALVAPTLVLTAAHCIVGRVHPVSEGEGLPKAPIRITLGRHRLERRVRWARWGALTFRTRGPDWAILTLDRPVESIKPFGVMDTGKLLALGGDRKLLNWAFPEDLNRNVPWGSACHIRHFIPRQQVFAHDCQTAPGASGSPLLYCPGSLDRCAVVAVHAAGLGEGDSYEYSSFSDGVANMAVPTTTFLPLLKTISPGTPIF